MALTDQIGTNPAREGPSGTKGRGKGEFGLLNWEIHLLAFLDISALGSQAFGLGLGSPSWLPWFSGLKVWTRSTSLAFPHLEFVDNRLWDSSASIIM